MSEKAAPMPYEEFASNLEDVFERVARERKAIVVEKRNGIRAVLKPAPIKATGRRRGRSVDSGEAFEAAFGGWKGIVDGDRLKKDVAASRGSRRPPVKL